MKKQLLTIAMLVSVFAAGNVLAAGEDDKNTDAPKTEKVSEGKIEASDTDKKEGSKEDQKDPKEGQDKMVKKVVNQLNLMINQMILKLITTLANGTTQRSTLLMQKITGKL